MLLLHVMLFLTTFLAQQVNCVSLDNAQALFDNFSEVVYGNILTALDRFDRFSYDLLVYRDNTQLSGELQIEEANTRYQLLLTQIKETSAQDGTNITSCLENTEDKLIELPELELEQLAAGVENILAQANQLIYDGRYRVDIAMTEVYELEFQLNKCTTDDSDCILTVYDNINSQVGVLPLQVQTEASEILDKINVLKREIDDFLDNCVAEFDSNASIILNEITDCINSL